MGYYAAGGPISMVASHTPGGVVAGSGAKALHAAPPADERRRPRMNAMNVHAARRAMRRLSSFERIARRVVSFTKPHAGRRFKFGRKKRR